MEAAAKESQVSHKGGRDRGESMAVLQRFGHPSIDAMAPLLLHRHVSRIAHWQVECVEIDVLGLAEARPRHAHRGGAAQPPRGDGNIELRQSCPPRRQPRELPEQDSNVRGCPTHEGSMLARGKARASECESRTSRSDCALYMSPSAHLIHAKGAPLPGRRRLINARSSERL